MGSRFTFPYIREISTWDYTLTAIKCHINCYLLKGLDFLIGKMGETRAQNSYHKSQVTCVCAPGREQSRPGTPLVSTLPSITGRGVRQPPPAAVGIHAWTRSGSAGRGGTPVPLEVTVSTRYRPSGSGSAAAGSGGGCRGGAYGQSPGVFAASAHVQPLQTL